MVYKIYEARGACFTRTGIVYEIVKRDYFNSVEDFIWDIEIELKRKYSSRLKLAYTTSTLSSRCSEVRRVDLEEFRYKYNLILELYGRYKSEVEDKQNENNKVRLNYLTGEYNRYSQELSVCNAIIDCYKELELW